MEKISKSKKKILLWLPRIISIIFVVFLILLSLDVFDLELGFWRTIWEFFMRNISTIFVLTVLIISWKRKMVGALFFIFVGLFYIISTTIRTDDWWFDFSWSLVVALPAIIVGTLFYFSWKYNEKKVEQAQPKNSEPHKKIVKI